MSKSRPGVCDICGHAVVRTQEHIVKNKAFASYDGHNYIDGKLVSVRCCIHYVFGGSRSTCDAHGGHEERDIERDII